MTKRANNGCGTIRQKSKNSWEGRFYDSEGNRRYVHAKTKTECQIKLNEMQTQVNQGTYITPDKTTFNEWASIWFDNYLLNIKTSTKSKYQDDFRINAYPSLGKIQLQKINPPVIQSLINKLSKPHMITDARGKEKESKGLSPKSLRNLHGELHECFKKAVECGYIRTNPCEATSLPKVESKEILAMEGDELPTFLDAIKGDDYELLFIVAVLTGMRESEIIGLTWDCVDFKKKVIHVVKQLYKPHSVSGCDYEFTTLKNNRIRKVYPCEYVFEILQEVKYKQQISRLASGSAFQNPYNLVFTNAVGGHLYPQTISKHLKKRCGTTDIQKFTEIHFHSLRHSYTVINIENGVDIFAVSKNLGHATTAFTMDRYGHFSEKMKRDSASKMQNFIQGIV